MMGSVVVVMRVGLVCKKTSHSDANHPVFLAPKPRETCCNTKAETAAITSAHFFAKSVAIDSKLN